MIDYNDNNPENDPAIILLQLPIKHRSERIQNIEQQIKNRQKIHEEFISTISTRQTILEEKIQRNQNTQTFELDQQSKLELNFIQGTIDYLRDISILNEKLQKEKEEQENYQQKKQLFQTNQQSP